MGQINPLHFLKSHIFLYYASAIFVLGYFPLYFEEMGFSKLQIGAIFAFGPFIGIFANVFWGYLSDKYQIIKKLLLFLIFMQLLLVIVLAQLENYYLIFSIMLLLFFFQSSIVPLTDSLTLLTTKALGRSFASFRIYGSFGFAIAAFALNPILQKLGYDYTLILYALTLGFVLTGATQLSERIGDSKNASFKGLLKLLNNKEILLVLGSIFLLAVAHRVNDQFISLYLKEIGQEKYIGISFMLAALSEIPIFMIISKYGSKVKSLHLLALAAFFYFIRYSIVAHASHPSYVVLAQLMHSVTFGVFYLTAIRYVSSVLPNQYRSSGQALFAITFSGAAGIASGLLGGWVYEFGSGKLLYTSASICALVACGLFLHLQIRSTSKNI